MRGWRIARVDLVVAVTFLAVGLVEELTAPERLPWWPLRLGFATALVLVRRAAPLLTTVLDVAVVQILLMPADVENFRVWQVFCLFIGLHTIGREIVLAGPDRDPRWRRIAAIVLVAGTIVVLLPQRSVSPSDVFATIGYLLAAWLSGLLLQLQARRLAERNAAVEAAQALRAREAVAGERARIARELHDMVAHSVTVMVLQAGAVRRRLGPGQDAERALLSGVEAAGRDAVIELRRTLELLRGDGAPAGHAGQRGLADIAELVAQVREAGLDVRVETAGDLRPLPPSLELSAYRIVQEALTNVLKHSRARRAAVCLAYQADELVLTVDDDGGGAPAALPSAGGHGLVGMQERVALFGGRLTAEPRPGGGFAVSAWLPLGRTSEQPAAAP